MKLVWNMHNEINSTYFSPLWCNLWKRHAENVKRTSFIISYIFFFFLVNSCQSVAVLMTCRQMFLFLAFLQAVWTPKFWGWTSSSTILSQVVLGRPADLLQSAGGWSAVATMWWWNSAGTVRARWPEKLRQWDLTTSETGVQAVTSRTISCMPDEYFARIYRFSWI